LPYARPPVPSHLSWSQMSLVSRIGYFTCRQINMPFDIHRLFFYITCAWSSYKLKILSILRDDARKKMVPAEL